MQKKQSMDVGTCPASASHETTACVPVSICPFAEPGEVCIENCGAPTINCGGEPCCGIVNGRFEFTISQKMKIDIPIVFGADIAIGEAYIHHGQTTGSVNGECSTHSCEECTECPDMEEEETVTAEAKGASDTPEFSAFSTFSSIRERDEEETNL